MHLYLNLDLSLFNSKATEIWKSEQRSATEIRRAISRSKTTATESECFAVILTMQSLRSYIEGTSFKAWAEHKALKKMLKWYDRNGRLIRGMVTTPRWVRTWDHLSSWTGSPKYPFSYQICCIHGIFKTVIKYMMKPLASNIAQLVRSSGWMRMGARYRSFQ